MESNSLDASSGGVSHERARTWYGLLVKITVTESNFHRVAVPGLVLPHPGMVNLIVRQGLPLDLRLALTSRHELGHLQTLPVPLLHLLLILWPRRGKPHGTFWLRNLVALLTHQALWEVAAEGYVVATDRRAYRVPRPSLARVICSDFWAGMAAISFIRYSVFTAS
jgi:hypothetical protein